MELVNRNIIFRCDSSIKIGTGHIFRTINIAKELKKYQSNIYFFCKNHLGNINYILNKDFKLIELPLKILSRMQKLLMIKIYINLG